MVANYAIDADWSIYVQSIARREDPVPQASFRLETTSQCLSQVSNGCPIPCSRSDIITMSEQCPVQQVVTPVSTEPMLDNLSGCCQP
jgi:hypothetical protein